MHYFWFFRVVSHDELADGYLKNLFSKGGKLKGVGGEVVVDGGEYFFRGASVKDERGK